MSNMLTPVAFAAFIAVTNRYDIAYLILAAFSLACVPLLYGIDRVPDRPAKRPISGRVAASGRKC